MYIAPEPPPSVNRKRLLIRGTIIAFFVFILVKFFEVNREQATIVATFLEPIIELAINDLN